MRLTVAAVGRLKDGPEHELAERYRKRAEQLGRRIGLREVEIVQVRESRAQEVGKRMIEESIAIANVIPEKVGDRHPRRARRKSRQRGAREATWRVARQWAARRSLHHWRRRRPGAGVARAGDAATRVRRRNLAAPVGAGACCSSRFTARSQFWRAIPITAPRKSPAARLDSGAILALLQRPMAASTRQTDSHFALSFALAPVLLLAITTNGLAQSTLDKLRQHDKELETVRSQQRQTADTEARLKREIGNIGDDRRKLNQTLIEAASRLRTVEGRVADTEARLKPLDDSERGIRQSLGGRRAAISEVLASLQRIGRNPPPAMMVRPEDALASIRTAIMLGAVLPDMRIQAESLAADLSDLVRIRRDIAEEKERLQRDVAALTEERQRVTLLMEERQKKQADTEKAIEEERRKTSSLARQVDNLKDLIGKIEQGLDAKTRSERASARATEEKSLNSRIDLAALKDPGRLAPAVAFASARGHLPLPVNGVRIREFGAPDTLGSTEKGLTIATRAGAQVTAPCDGWVVYAGFFRNYGQVLILNAGGGYHVVLAGMERISVDVGQFVLTGEPVAIMGSGSQVAATLASGSNQPVLYVEFRKDGTPVDPSPWWAASEGEKVRG